jgi:sugar-specific transcriptional regulator TrmB
LRESQKVTDQPSRIAREACEGRRKRLSQEQVLKTLIGLGLTRLDPQVYIYLAKRGPKKGQELSKALKLQKQQIYRSLKKLKSKGIVSATLEHPARFSAVSFEKVVDIFVKAKMAEAQRIQENKNEILANWQAISIGETSDTTAKFNVIEGRGPIYSKMLQMMKEAQKQLSTISTVTNLLRADQFGLFDTEIKNQIEPAIHFRVIAELSEQDVKVTKKLLKEIANAKIIFEVRTPDLRLNFPQMIIKDEGEVLFFISPKTKELTTDHEDVCLWTDCKSLVQAFTSVFEDLWCNSTDIRDEIAEIETGKPTPKTRVIGDAGAARKKYDETVQAATEEIVLMTSAEGLVDYLKNSDGLKEWTAKGVSVKIMAPIMNKNLEAAQRLSKFCSVRHVPTDYPETTMVDGSHFFQFKSTPVSKGKLESHSHFTNVFYTDDPEYVAKMKNTLNYMWKNARAPSAIPLESIIDLSPKPTINTVPEGVPPHLKKMPGGFVDRMEEGKVTEKEILNKILTAKKSPVLPSKDVGKAYGSLAGAVIHPPVDFNLPDNMVIHVYRMEKQSALGEEDAIAIYLLRKTPIGHVYVPVAVVGNNPNTHGFWKLQMAGSPAERNVQLVEKDELQIRIHGKTLFAGWTVNIPLLPPRYSLPPACLLIEGYGDVKTVTYTTPVPSGYNTFWETNVFRAFVTFFHPSSKYSGPGTEGFFIRDFVATTYPPSTT